jgi:ribosomal-protein-alanine N-acetyltransferase
MGVDQEADRARFTLQPMDEQAARAIALWQYDGPYAFYNSDPGDLAELLDPTRWPDAYFSVMGIHDELIGFFQFTPRDECLEIGLGLRPDATGKGLGLDFVLAGLEFARQRFAPRSFSLDVATFNARAIRVYERAGFRPIRVYLRRTERWEQEFLEMRKET